MASTLHVAAQPTKVFGQHIETIIKAQQARGAKSDVPQVITESILWLESHQGTALLRIIFTIFGNANALTLATAISTKNIFRALGHAPTVQHIKAEFDGM